MRRTAATTCAVALFLCACTAPGARPTTAPIRNEVHRAPRVPDTADLAAADLAGAALAADFDAAERALVALERVDAARRAEGQRPTGLAPVAGELAQAAVVSGRRHREALEALLDRNDLDPAHRERIERELADDPLVRADARIFEARSKSIARAFNMVVEPIGRSLLSSALAPVRLGRSFVRYAVTLYREDPLPLQRRQALAHWKEFLERYPEAPEREELEEEVAKAQARWHQTKRRQVLEQAESALDRGDSREALVLADRALRHSPEHAGATALRDAAEARLLTQREGLRWSERFVEVPPAPVATANTRALALAVLGGSSAAIADLEADPENIGAQAFAIASTATREEARSDEILRTLAEQDPATHAMARHASAALADPFRNPYGLFEQARARDRRTKALWVLGGPLATAPPETSVVGVVESLVAFPAVIQSVLTLPIRVLQLPWMTPPRSSKATAVQARRYLALHPDGLHADEVTAWLEGYQLARDNYMGALRVAERRDPDGDHRELEEKAASQALRVARAEDRPDIRHAMLRGVTRRFPDTEAGDEAGRAVRDELESHTPHKIVISRGFLEENPEVAGPHGLDLDPALLDEDTTNGELHPDGIAWVGARELDLAYVGRSGDPEDPAETLSLVVSQERLAQLVARLEETSFRNSLLDAEDPVVPDAGRDLVFERARLGLSEEPDLRPSARADFTYRGMRERYGMVRRREPLLPFDLVVSGSLADLSLGAFPRLREPRETEDALLYE